MKTNFLMWADYPFEDYPTGCRVTHVKYDGNKYCTFILPNGKEGECKSGYLHKSLKDMKEWYRKHAGMSKAEAWRRWGNK
jgi:hypothetical protein